MVSLSDLIGTNELENLLAIITNYKSLLTLHIKYKHKKKLYIKKLLYKRDDGCLSDGDVDIDVYLQARLFTSLQESSHKSPLGFESSNLHKPTKPTVKTFKSLFYIDDLL